MDSPDTTNISDLPIAPTPPTNSEESIRNLQLSTQTIHQDNGTVIQSLQEEKKVRFEEDLQRKDPPQPLTQDISKSPQFVLTMEHKVVLLAVFFFFVFQDPKFRKYMLNILVQIFGAFLKTETGNLTKIGMFVYSLLYGLVLWCCVTFIDLASFHLAF